jgi:hypothetical protein
VKISVRTTEKYNQYIEISVKIFAIYTCPKKSLGR